MEVAAQGSKEWYIGPDRFDIRHSRPFPSAEQAAIPWQLRDRLCHAGSADRIPIPKRRRQDRANVERAVRQAIAPHEFWQTIHPAGTFEAEPEGGHADFYPAALPDGRQLLLPIRPLPDGNHALASLILNQASFEVEDTICTALAGVLEALAPDVVIGLPTLGLSLARGTARALGHRRFVPLGTSVKFWYDESLSVPLSSITSPGRTKRLYLDPRMRALLEGRRVALVDDVISSGASLAAALDLLDRIGVAPVAVGTAMLQTSRWLDALSRKQATLPDRVRGVMRTPLLKRNASCRWDPAN